MPQRLKACPACGKQAGEVKASRFPFWVKCGACGWITEPVKLEAAAVKLWNEAKGEGKNQSATQMSISFDQLILPQQ